MNIFDTAKAKTPTKTTKPKGKAKVEINIAGLEDLAIIKTVEKALAGLSSSLEADVKCSMANEFITLANGRKPDSFTGIEGTATASCQLRKRSGRSVLTTAEQELLAANGVSTETIEDVKETFVINPEYRDNSELLGKVSDAISSIDGLPSDFIIHQAQEARVVTTATSLDEVFQADPAVMKQLLDVVGTLAVKPTLASGDITDTLAKLNKILA